MPRVRALEQRKKQTLLGDIRNVKHPVYKEIKTDSKRFTEFVSKLYGRAVFPGDDDYDTARREFNPAYPSFPKVIVFCLCLEDIRTCLGFAHDTKLQAVVRSGRHSLAGYSGCDGIVIDVSELNSISIDHTAMTVTVGAGCPFLRLNANLESFGYHLPGGGCPTVGVAGYMQGGGYGFTSREFGIHSDNVESFKMVLADGRQVTANEQVNSDLFWAVRGGTGNQFGILIETTYKIYELDKIWGIRLDWAISSHPENAAQALKVIQDQYIRKNDHDKLGFQTLITYDSEIDQQLRLIFLATFNGNQEAFDVTLQPLLDIPNCEQRLRLHDVYSKVDEGLLANHPDLPLEQITEVKAISQSTYIARDLSESEWREILDYIAIGTPNRYTMIDMEGYGGKINSVSPSESAFMHRDVTVDLFCDVFWIDEKDREQNRIWIQNFMHFMDKFSNGHSYQNYPSRDQKDWRWAYFGPYYPWLVYVKEKYDPANFFHYQQSITAEIDPQHKDEYLPVPFEEKDIVYEDEFIWQPKQHEAAEEK